MFKPKLDGYVGACIVSIVVSKNLHIKIQIVIPIKY